jgi:hypothetical protein
MYSSRTYAYIGHGYTSMAAPVAVEGGGVFDAEYYAENNADVVAAVGTDFSALWQHYTLFGVNEGRLPFAVGTDWEYVLANGPFQSLSNSQTVTTTTTTEKVATEDTTTTTSTDVSTDEVAYAQTGVAYPISLIQSGYDDKNNNYEWVDENVVNNTSVVYTEGVSSLRNAPAGYEWRYGKLIFAETDYSYTRYYDGQLNFVGDYYYSFVLNDTANRESIDVNDLMQYFVSGDEEWEWEDGYYSLVKKVGETHDGEAQPVETINEGLITRAWKFDVVCADGSIKTGYYTEGWDMDATNNDYYAYDTFYYMVPSDFSSHGHLLINGTKLENGEVVENTADSLTFLVK